jgi:hypothetical protein
MGKIILLILQPRKLPIRSRTEFKKEKKEHQHYAEKEMTLILRYTDIILKGFDDWKKSNADTVKLTYFIVNQIKPVSSPTYSRKSGSRTRAYLLIHSSKPIF